MATNMYQFTAGSSNPAYPLPPGQQQSYATYQQPQQPQQYQQSYPAASQVPAQQYYTQAQYPGATQPYQPPTTAPSQPYGGAATYSQPPGTQPYQYPGSGQAAPYQQPRKHSAPTPILDPQACYNCGVRGHIAQHCPEPRRAVPAGSLAPRPPKRQKTGGPVVTRYLPPPGYQPQRGYTYPQAGQQPYSASAPLSGYTQQYTNPQPQQQQASPVSQPTPTGQWLPTPGSYGSQMQSPVSANSNTQSFFPPVSSVSATPIGFGGTTQSSPPRIEAQSSSATPGSQFAATPQDSATSQKQEDPLEIKLPGETELEPWLEDLQALDDAQEHKPGSGPKIYHPANPVARPLPSTMDAADALGRLPIAATLPPGTSVSLILREMSEQDLEKNIRDTAEWSDLQDDPIFIDISTESETITVHDLVAQREELRHPEDDDEEEENEESDNDGMDIDPDYDRRSYSEPEEEFEQSPTDDRRDQDDSASREEYEDRYSRGRRSRDQDSLEREDRRPSRRRSPRPDDRRDQHFQRSPSYNYHPRNRRRSSSRNRRSHSRDRRPSYRENSHREYRNSRDRRDSYKYARHGQQGTYYDRKDRRRGSWERPPPPPPPPPPPSSSRRSGSQSRISPGPNVNGGSSKLKGDNQSPTKEQDVSMDPTSLSPAWGKPEVEGDMTKSEREKSVESSSGPRRQEEEMSRAKKRQPQVAAAYSRRW